jgi:dTDP-4-amino-4,6-dideoxygalactose transaminase
MSALASTTGKSASAVARYLVPDLPLTDELAPYLRRIDETRWYSNFGPLVCEFEERLRSLLSDADEQPDAGEIQLTTLVSGHHALEVGLHFSGIGPGKRVLVPAVTFSACPLAAQHMGAQVILGDVDPVSWTLTPEIARAIAAGTKIDAVMPVAAYGIPLPTPGWDDFYLDTGISVVIDAAAAIGTQSIPRNGLVAHSLHATKPLGVGEGGVLVGRDSNTIARARRYTNFGMVDRITHTDGTNAKMSEYHAAVGQAQLDRWVDIKKRRSQLLRSYRRHLGALAGYVSLHPSIETAVVSCLMLLMKDPFADAVLMGIQHKGIGLHRTYLPPLYRHPYFADLAVASTRGIALSPDTEVQRKWTHMTNSEGLMERLVGVPFHTFMSEADVATVVEDLEAQLTKLRGDAVDSAVPVASPKAAIVLDNAR